MKMKIRIEGTDEIRRKLLAMSETLRRETLEPIMDDNLQPMAASMRALAARRTGEMADSVTVSPDLSPHQATINEPIAEIEMFVGPGPLPQAIQEEFGNFREPPHPFIRPSYDAHVNQALTGIGRDGVAAILKTAKKG